MQHVKDVESRTHKRQIDIIACHGRKYASWPLIAPDLRVVIQRFAD